ncbi:MAG: hypothetical protein Q8P56_06125, partial [Candidatus Uhrbacteria bacterium]|nr:hypothetical protein [Candidatus Uhrbacteria bacterium]
GQPIVLIDDQKVFDVTSLQNEQAMEKITGALEGSTVGANSILLLRLAKTVEEETIFLTTEEFFGLTTRFAPDQLIRSLEKTFAFGILGWSGNQPFLIFKTDSFENTSSGMTEWERTMPMELKTLFETENGWAETTPAFGPGSTSQSQFGNTVVSNLDARQLTNSAGATVLIYSFPDTNTLIITTNEQPFAALVTKLRNAKLVR